MNLFKNLKKTENLGLNLKPGDEHYRAYVGPPQDYDLIAASVFNLLTTNGLRQHHKLLDVGCGSLRLGRLFIPYLNQGNYLGVEPNKWLVTEGIKNEVGGDLVRIKKPVFSYKGSLEEFKQPLSLDYVVAQSIFSHTGIDLLSQWLNQIHYHLKNDGHLFATFIVNQNEDFSGNGWIYPECVSFKAETIINLAKSLGFELEFIDWFHPRQKWAKLRKLY